MAVWTTPLARLPTLAFLAFISGHLCAQLLRRLDKLTIVDHLPFELHHHGHPLLIYILQQVGKRILQRVEFCRQQQVALVQL